MENRKEILRIKFVKGAAIISLAVMKLFAGSSTGKEIQGSKSEDNNAVSKETTEVNNSTSGIFGHDADTY